MDLLYSPTPIRRYTPIGPSLRLSAHPEAETDVQDANNKRETTHLPLLLSNPLRFRLTATTPPECPSRK